MIRNLIVIGVGLLLVACKAPYPSIVGTSSAHPSPDGDMLILVHEERSEANDPSLRRTHVSLRKKSDSLLVRPGNLLVANYRASVRVEWLNNSSVILFLDGWDLGEELVRAISPQIVDGVEVTLREVRRNDRIPFSEQIAARRRVPRV